MKGSKLERISSAHLQYDQEITVEWKLDMWLTLLWRLTPHMYLHFLNLRIMKHRHSWPSPWVGFTRSFLFFLFFIRKEERSKRRKNIFHLTGCGKISQKRHMTLLKNKKNCLLQLFVTPVASSCGHFWKLTFSLKNVKEMLRMSWKVNAMKVM